MSAEVALKKAWKLLFLNIALFPLGLLTGLSFAEERGSEREIFRRPLPFVSFLERSLLRVPATEDITVGDLNGDGHPDLIFHTSDPGVFWTSSGDGKGNFALPKKHGFETGYSDRITGTTLLAGDFNGDGRDEIISLQRRRITSDTTKADLFLVSSDLISEDTVMERAAISLPHVVTGPHNGYFLFDADMDGDRQKDFVLGNTSAQECLIVKNLPEMWTPALTNVRATYTTPIRAQPRQIDTRRFLHVLMLDANNDGLADILRIGDDGIFVFHGDRNVFSPDSDMTWHSGLITTPSPRIPFGPESTIFHGRFDRDEFLDLLIVSNSGKCWILKNSAGHGFSFFINLDYSESPNVRSGDFNGDGLDDLITYGRGHKGIRILLNDGAGHFRAVDRSTEGKAIRGLTVHDINADGLSDIILTVSGTLWGMEGKVLLNISQRPQN